MMTNHYNSIEDLLFDKSFRDWILYRKDDNNFWVEWVKSNPEKSDNVNFAKAILYTLSVRNAEISEDEIEFEINKILCEMDKGFEEEELLEVNTEGVLINKQVKFKKWLGFALLGIVIFLGVGYFITDKNSALQSDNQTSQTLKVGERDLVSYVKYNGSDTTEVILLPDGSQVLLSPKSKLIFAKSNFPANREVSLQGEAFFNVHKDAAHPFTVRTKSVVTKVLGTSFLVKEFSNDKTASVIVKTGRVSVFKEKDFTESKGISDHLTGIILTPNQQLTYTLADNELNKSIIEKPVILPTFRPVFNFRATPVKDVFKGLDEAYGINIIYDAELIDGRTLSASFGEEDFYQKLMIVCKAINAFYEVIDGTVVINFKK